MMGKHAVGLIAYFILLLVLSLSFASYTSAQNKDTIATLVNPFDEEIITDNSVPLQFTFWLYNVNSGSYGDRLWAKSVEYYVYLDGQLCYHNQSDAKTIGISGWKNNYTFFGPELNLQNYTQGKHSLKVVLDLKGYVSAILPVICQDSGETTINFYLDKGIQPCISILDSNAYPGSQTTFTITTNEYDSTVSYSLDGAANVTLSKTGSKSIQNQYGYDVTFMGLPKGLHTLTAYVKDNLNQTAVAELTFISPLSFQAITIVLLVLAGIVFVVLLVFRKKILLFLRKSSS